MATIRTDHRPSTLSTGRPVDWVGGAAALLHAFCLNLMWLVGCALVLTGPAATTAMVAAVRRWRIDGDLPSGRVFVADLRRRFWRDLAVGVLALAVAAFFAVDLVAIGQLGAERRVLLVVWIAVAATVLLASVFTTPVAAQHLTAGEIGSLRSTAAAAARLAVRSPGRALIAALIVFGAAALVSVSPISLLGVGVPTAVLLERLADPSSRATTAGSR